MVGLPAKVYNLGQYSLRSVHWCLQLKCSADVHSADLALDSREMNMVELLRLYLLTLVQALVNISNNQDLYTTLIFVNIKC